MRVLFVDTNILIDFSHGNDTFLSPYLRSGHSLVINPIVVAEFMNNRSLRTKEKQKEALEFLKLFTHFPITFEIGLTAGALIRRKEVEFIADSFIAATCIVADLALLTRNQKHFAAVEDLKLLPVIS